MLFKQIHLNGIKSGELDLAFRKWKSPRVLKGSLINTSVGRIEIIDIVETSIEKIGDAQCHRAGYDNKAQLLKIFEKIKDGKIYQIKVRYHSEDPRIKLRSQTEVSLENIEKIKSKLERLDVYGKQGKWTLMVMQLIKDNPKVRAADLAQIIGKEKMWLKLNVRKLKNLGLTISHGVGYSISPLGKQVMKYLKSSN